MGETAELRGRKEGRKRGGGKKKDTTKANPKTKALGFRSQHAIGLSPRWKSRRTTRIAKERSGNLRER
jgi:hypothetical protein